MIIGILYIAKIYYCLSLTANMLHAHHIARRVRVRQKEEGGGTTLRGHHAWPRPLHI